MLISENGYLYEISEREKRLVGHDKQVIFDVVGTKVNISLQDYLGNPLPWVNVPLRLSGDIETQEIIITDGVLELAIPQANIVVVESLLSYYTQAKVEVIGQ